jgi:AcrR family transcriptional regulator
MEADKIKDSIKRAAQDLFRKFGYHKTSVNEIAKRAKDREGYHLQVF